MIVRELKAVGGDLRALRLALTGRRRGPRARGRARRDPAGGGAGARRPRRPAPDYDRRVRVHDTLTGSLVELPAPPGPIGMYVCGPTVYQRAHIGNARPFVVFSWLRNWLREQGYEVTFVHNVTDVNDKIYDAAPGAQRRARRARDRLVPRGHG